MSSLWKLTPSKPRLQKPESSISTSTMETLPFDVTVEIFSRVPISSIGTFRCVSKYWLNLTTQPSFIQSHLNLSTQHHSSNLIIFSRDDINRDAARTSWGDPSSLTTLYSAPTNLLHTPLTFQPLPSSFSLLSSKLAGSCNGIISLICWHQVCLLNPCTREYKIIDFDNRFHPKALNGFGYHPTHHDYKFVQIVSLKSFDSKMIVYSMNNPSSRFEIPSIPYQILNKGAPGFFLNGAIHWVAKTDPTLLSCTIILAFDIEDNNFRELQRPADVDNEADITIGVLRGKLYLVCSFVDTNFEIWVMEDYGVQESWFKLFSTKEIADEEQLNLPYARPLCYFEDFKILLESGGCLLLCDLKLAVLSRVTHGFDWKRLYGDLEQKIICNVGSLVSLKSGTYLGTIG